MGRLGYDPDFGGETEEQATRHRAAIAKAEAERKAAGERAAEQRAQAHLAAEQADIERRVKANFVGSPEQWANEREELLKAERHRMAAERDASERRENAARYW